jgi:hypothetical protein
MHLLGVLYELGHITHFLSVLLAQQRQQLPLMVRDKGGQETVPTLGESLS